jgi:hypothetical protein
MNCTACSRPVAPGNAWCQSCGAVAPSPAVPRGAVPAVADPSRTAANRALLASALAPCCGPIGLVGAYLAVRSMVLARRHARPFPWRAVPALLVAAAALVVWTAFTGALVATQLEDRKKEKALQERLAGKREAESVDQALACDLVEEQLRAGLYERWSVHRTTCHGPLETGPGWALLRDVELQAGGDTARLNACLAHTRRWFVLKMTAATTCPTVPEPQAGQSPEDAERAARQEAADQADRDDTAAFAGALVAVKEALESSPRVERTCPALNAASIRGGTHDHLRLPTIDLEKLDAPAEKPYRAEWTFLTSSDVNVAVNPHVPTALRAAALRKMGREAGPYLLVYLSEQRSWPTDGERGRGLGAPGEFAGWMVVVDRHQARPVCEARLRFTTSARFWDRSERRQTVEAAVKDFKKQFEERAIASMRTMSEGQFRLGYRLLE